MQTLTIILILISVISVSTTLFISLSLRKMKNTLNDYTSLMYAVIKRNDSLEESMNDNMNKMNSNLSQILTVSNETKNAMTSLTSSVYSILKHNKEEREKKVYPTAQMMEAIDSVITEHVLMCAFLIREQRIADPPAKYITERISRAYPNLDYEYICERVLYIMDQFNHSSTGQKAQ